MAGWVDDLLKEWRERLAALAGDSAPVPEQRESSPTHALDLLRSHVARSGVQLKLSEALPNERRAAERRATERRATHLKAVETEASDSTADSGLKTGFARFGRRQYPASAEGATERLARLPQEVLQTPAETRRAAQAFRAAAYGEVEALRTDVARLKEALADVMVENRRLKRLLESQPDIEPDAKEPLSSRAM